VIHVCVCVCVCVCVIHVCVRVCVCLQGCEVALSANRAQIEALERFAATAVTQEVIGATVVKHASRAGRVGVL
jgi:hypothetical protein